MKLRNRTLCELSAAVGIIVVSTLPYFHDLVTDPYGVREWVPVIGVERVLSQGEGDEMVVMGFSSYRMFLYTFFIHLFAHIGFVGWMMDAKGKSYRIALVVPVILSGYTVALLLFNAKASEFNSTGVKFFITIIATIGVIVFYFLDRRRKLNLKEP